MTVTTDDVLKALEQTVRDRLPGVLAVLSAERGLTLDLPKSYEQVSGPDAANELAPRQTPRLSFSSPGLTDEPAVVGRGVWDMTWECLIALWVRSDKGPSYADIARNVRVYTHAVALSVLGDRSLGGLASAVQPYGEFLDFGGDEDPKTQRTLGVGSVRFAVTVPQALDLNAPLTDNGTVLGLPPQPDGWKTTITATARERQGT